MNIEIRSELIKYISTCGLFVMHNHFTILSSVTVIQMEIYAIDRGGRSQGSVTIRFLYIIQNEIFTKNSIKLFDFFEEI